MIDSSILCLSVHCVNSIWHRQRLCQSSYIFADSTIFPKPLECDFCCEERSMGTWNNELIWSAYIDGIRPLFILALLAHRPKSATKKKRGMIQRRRHGQQKTKP